MTVVAAEPTAISPDRPPRWSRVLLAAGLALALLLIGATGGLLIAPDSSNVATPTSDSVDVGFAQDMSVHHDNAVTMAGWMRDHTSDPALTQLAYDIESGQTAQIGRMQGWLGLWNAAPLPTGGYMRWMPQSGMGYAASGAAQMPGMANQGELARFRASSGPESDVLFLQLMLRHHESGVPMLRYAADNAGQPEVRNLAAQMLTAQTTESQFIRQMLAARGAQPLAPS